jgi:DEAD/DEAH box helicase domain-containing protein
LCAYPHRLAAGVKEGLSAAGIPQLFSHQVEGINAVLDGAPAVLATTATSSGKSLMYTIPIAEAYLKWRVRAAETAIYGTPEPAPRALLIFPTKALAHDQLGKLRALLSEDGNVCPGIRVETLDGDTSFRDRPSIIAGAHVILTNPDMLHVSILPQHPKFAVVRFSHVFITLLSLSLAEGRWHSY